MGNMAPVDGSQLIQGRLEGHDLINNACITLLLKREGFELVGDDLNLHSAHKTPQVF